MPSEGATCHLHLFLPPSHAVHVSGLRMWGERNELLWQPPAWAGKPRVTYQLSLAPSHVSPTSSHLPREKVQDEISLALSCVPWGRGGASLGRLHPALPQRIQTHSFGLRRWAETSLLEARTSQRLSGLWVTALDRVFQGLATGPRLGRGVRAARASSRAISGSSQSPSCIPVSRLVGKQDSSQGPLAQGAGGHTPRRRFCSRFDAKLPSLRAKQRTSYSATRLTSLSKGLSF